MIPVLFNKDEYQFNQMGKGLLNEAYNCVVHEIRNGIFELEMEYPLNGLISNQIQLMDIVYAQPREKASPHPFRIYDIDENTIEETVLVKAITITNDLSNVLIKEFEVFDTDDVKDIEKRLNDSIPDERMKKLFKFQLDVKKRRPLIKSKWEYVSPMFILNELLGKMFYGEIIHDGYTIKVVEERGMDNGVTIRYGKNLDGYKVIKSTKSLKTRVIGHIPKPQEQPVAPTTDVSSIEYNEDGSPKLPEMPPMPQISVDGTMPPQEMIYSEPVDSKHIGDYPIPYMELVDVSQNQEINNKEKLDEYMRKYFTEINPGCDIPSVSISVDLFQLSDFPEYFLFKDLEHISICDTVTVLVGNEFKLKISEITYDVLQEKTTSLKAGNEQQTLFQQQVSGFTNTISNVLHYTDNVANTVIPMVNGKNKVFRGFNEPDSRIATVGDIWYKLIDQTGNHATMHVFNGGSWTPVSYNANDITTGNLNLNQVNLVGLTADMMTSGRLTISNNLVLANQNPNKPPILSVDNLGNVVFNVDKMTIRDQEADSKKSILDAAQKHMETLVGQMSKVDSTQEIGMVSKYTDQSLEQILFRLPTNSQESTIRVTNGGLEAYRVMTEDSVHIGNIRIEKYGDSGIAFRYVKRR